MSVVLAAEPVNVELFPKSFYVVDMTNQQLVDNGHRMMDDTDQAIERSKKVCPSNRTLLYQLQSSIIFLK